METLTHSNKKVKYYTQAAKMINSDWVESGRVGDLLHQEILNNQLKVSNGLHKCSSYKQ
jgi:hypothetical protein